jgi:hypothetical protein
VNLDFADALCRRLEPAPPLAAVRRRPLFDVVGVCDAVLAIVDAHASRRPRAYFDFFAVLRFAVVFLADDFFAADFVFAFVAFFAMLPS